MSALFLLMIAPLALAAFRAVSSLGVSRAPALAAAAAVALVFTIPPAWLLREKPSRGSPSATPRAPVFASNDPGALELQVEFGTGWDPPDVDDEGRAVRRMTGSAELVVGPLGRGRPASTLEFDAAARPRAPVVARLAGRTLARGAVGRRPTRVRVTVPPGDGPAVLQLEAGHGAAMTVFVASARAVARVGR